jgi:hypothetical protein
MHQKNYKQTAYATFPSMININRNNIGILAENLKHARILLRHVLVCKLKALMHTCIFQAWTTRSFGCDAIIVTKLSFVNHQGAGNIYTIVTQHSLGNNDMTGKISLILNMRETYFLTRFLHRNTCWMKFM